MTPSMKVGIAGVVLGLILLIVLPWWAAVGIIIIAAAIPVGGYMTLDQVTAPPPAGDPRPPARRVAAETKTTPASGPARCPPAGAPVTGPRTPA